jgi:hypothetical protein
MLQNEEYDNSDNIVTKNQFLTVNMLNVLKLSTKDSHEYEENLKVKLMLPVNENGCCNIGTPRMAKRIFSFYRQNNSSKNI